MKKNHYFILFAIFINFIFFKTVSFGCSGKTLEFIIWNLNGCPTWMTVDASNGERYNCYSNENCSGLTISDAQPGSYRVQVSVEGNNFHPCGSTAPTIGCCQVSVFLDGEKIAEEYWNIEPCVESGSIGIDFNANFSAYCADQGGSSSSSDSGGGGCFISTTY